MVNFTQNSKRKVGTFYKAIFYSLVAILNCSWWSIASAQSAETFGTWRLDCKEYDTSGGHCVGHQIVTKGTSNKEVVLGVMVSYANEHSAPHIIFRTTPEANVKKGVAVKIDQNKFLRVPISSCDEKVCEVRSLIPKGLLQQMLSGKQLLFAFFIDETQHTYPVSLVGFKEMMTNLSMNESRS